MKEFKLMTIDNKILNVYLWDETPNKPKAVLQLVHGSVEHMMRYDDFAKWLNQHDVIVIGDDHRGHGKTASDNNMPLGYFAYKDGWTKMVNDEKTVNSHIQKLYPDLPIIMLGHSMGSIMAREYAIKYSQTIDGLILMGVVDFAKPIVIGGMILTKIIRLFNGPKKPSKLMWKLSYYPFNKRWKSKKSNGLEWLSSDVNTQKDYASDPLNGFIFSNSAFYDMLSGVNFTEKKSNIKLMRKNLPILIVSGKDDPVGKYGSGPAKAEKKFTSLGYNTTLKIYPKMRHEILNEIDKILVYEDCLTFIIETAMQVMQK